VHAPLTNSGSSTGQRDETVARGRPPPGAHESMFRQLFERSADAILLFDPSREVFVDCNQAAVEMMCASCKEQLLMVHPAELSPEFQPDGQSSRQKTPEVIELAIRKGSHRFEWLARRMDGREFFLEVLLTPIQTGEQPLMATVCRDITERKTGEAALRESEARFRSLFERSADAMSLFDPRLGRFIESNMAAARQTGAPNVEALGRASPAEISPEHQPNGRRSEEMFGEMIKRTLEIGSVRFEWMMRCYDGRELPVDMVLTAIPFENRSLLFAVSRDISDRKRAERDILELNASLEQRVTERTAALKTSEAQFRALVEHAPEAIVVFDGHTGRFLFGNEHACRLYGVPMEKLAALTPADVSPEFQPGGRRSSELAREKMDQALAGGTSIFEWTHQRPDGGLVPTDVRLLRLPAEGQNLLRASIIDNTESKRAQRALRESEEKFRALFEGSSQGVVLHDEEQILEVNPAAVRIMGCQSPHELLGKHPSDTSPPFQPNGESSVVLARNFIQECMDKGSARFDWMARTPLGREIPLEVTLTRIQWSGRQVIQALVSDISERKRAEAELRASEARLRESEARFSAAFRASPVFITISRLDDGRYVLANDAFLKWSGYGLQQVLGHNSEELALWVDPVDRARFWDDLRRTRSIRERECRVRNRHGRVFTKLLSADIIEINGVPHLLVVGLDISQRKQAEAELRASEARLRESEARFSAAFQSSPIMTGITRASDGRFVLVNDAALNWVGCNREDVIGRTSVELGLWENPADRERFWNELRSSGSIRQVECRLRNFHGKASTMLASGVTIEIDGEDHLLVMMVDISQRKQAEAELLKTLAREMELSQLKGNFVSMVSHEFRTPLGIIQSSAELLRDFHQKMQPAERNEQLESISRNTRRMATMMEEILILSRLDAGKLDFQPTACDLNGFFRRMVDEVLSATNRRCRIDLSLTAIPAEGKADERLLGHIFANLLSNAVKYSEPGARVSFAVERDGADAVCMVQDQGIGIAAEDQEHLFQAFHRGVNVGTRPGTGLGLLVVKRCVELHRGNVQVVSTLGEGTTVIVRIPVFGKDR